MPTLDKTWMNWSPRQPRTMAYLVLLLASPALAAPAGWTIDESLPVPAGMDAAQALAIVADLGVVFDYYEPVVPRVPGVSVKISKQVLSYNPLLVALPIEGQAFGRSIHESAQVSVDSEPLLCAPDTPGVRIYMSFQESSSNVARRIDGIEITACPREDVDGSLYIDVTGELFEGYLPRDPDLNAFNEMIGANALQTAFIKQVPAVFEAVELAWADRDVQAASFDHSY